MLGPVSSHTAAETRQVVASLESQPTVAGHSGDHPPDLETLRAPPARPHQILIQGNLAQLRDAATTLPRRHRSATLTRRSGVLAVVPLLARPKRGGCVSAELSAVDRDTGARNEAGCVAGQEHHQVREF